MISSEVWMFLTRKLLFLTDNICQMFSILSASYRSETKLHLLDESVFVIHGSLSVSHLTCQQVGLIVWLIPSRTVGAFTASLRATTDAFGRQSPVNTVTRSTRAPAVLGKLLESSSDVTHWFVFCHFEASCLHFGCRHLVFCSQKWPYLEKLG